MEYNFTKLNSDLNTKNEAPQIYIKASILLKFIGLIPESAIGTPTTKTGSIIFEIVELGSTNLEKLKIGTISDPDKVSTKNHLFKE